MIPGVVMVLVVGPILAALAKRKGYHAMCWFFAWGIIGLIVLAFLPRVTHATDTNSDDPAVRQAVSLAKRGNRIGTVLSIIVGVLVVVQVISLVTSGHETSLF